MAIYKPGQRHRNHNLLKRRMNRRGVTAILSLTAMVDMFTVLAIFLLQNYNSTGEILYLPKEVTLPTANRVVDLKPALVVTVSTQEILIDTTPVATFAEVQASRTWVIPGLRDRAKEMIEKARLDQAAQLQNRVSNVVDQTLGNKTEDPNQWKKVTIQADKSVDYLTLKKIMYSIYEAGGGPINFAVAKDLSKDDATSNAEN
ncbi:ExbD/TolR family protein [Pseudobdellovibrio exovorus]|uniref:Adventurous gliding motility protein S n=1 Tax=Pseudobdellovibrio exovorus JSS TaxID=1184267 RepID=M4VP93_9BACT|nr:biopolymer transporter ExbD [Pseudobdellovibrio exovorus]AGH94954.1 adventurous gliding motility protein S [Pseudobdellovibrio exovorus JSS]